MLIARGNLLDDISKHAETFLSRQDRRPLSKSRKEEIDNELKEEVWRLICGNCGGQLDSKGIAFGRTPKSSKRCFGCSFFEGKGCILPVALEDKLLNLVAEYKHRLHTNPESIFPGVDDDVLRSILEDFSKDREDVAILNIALEVKCYDLALKMMALGDAYDSICTFIDHKAPLDVLRKCFDIDDEFLVDYIDYVLAKMPRDLDNSFYYLSIYELIQDEVEITDETIGLLIEHRYPSMRDIEKAGTIQGVKLRALRNILLGIIFNQPELTGDQIKFHNTGPTIMVNILTKEDPKLTNAYLYSLNSSDRKRYKSFINGTFKDISKVSMVSEAFIVSVAANQIELVELLIKNGVDVNYCDARALETAFVMKNVPMMKLLLNNGASFSVLNQNYWFPWYGVVKAMNRNDTDLILAALEAGLDPRIRSGPNAESFIEIAHNKPWIAHLFTNYE